jgi:hypothetical protein
MDLQPAVCAATVQRLSCRGATPHYKSGVTLALLPALSAPAMHGPAAWHPFSATGPLINPILIASQGCSPTPYLMGPSTLPAPGCTRRLVDKSHDLGARTNPSGYPIRSPAGWSSRSARRPFQHSRHGAARSPAASLTLAGPSLASRATWDTLLERSSPAAGHVGHRPSPCPSCCPPRQPPHLSWPALASLPPGPSPAYLGTRPDQRFPHPPPPSGAHHAAQPHTAAARRRPHATDRRRPQRRRTPLHAAARRRQALGPLGPAPPNFKARPSPGSRHTRIGSTHGHAPLKGGLIPRNGRDCAITSLELWPTQPSAWQPSPPSHASCPVSEPVSRPAY